MQDFWIILIVSLLGISASLLGCFLMFRKMAMLTDAISHSILPGIVIAYLLLGRKDNVTALLIASIFGILSSLLVVWIEKKLKNRNDAATGISFTFLFAVGIILVTLFAEQADLDTECVLFGEMLYIPFETIWVSTNEIPRTLPFALLTFILVVLFVLFAYRTMTIISFDEIFAISVGISVTTWNYILLSLVSVLTVASFEVLGSVLVIALFIFPPATAFLLTKRLEVMFVLSLIFSVLTIFWGYYLSVWQGGSSAASIVIVQGIIFTLALIYNKKVASVNS